VRRRKQRRDTHARNFLVSLFAITYTRQKVVDEERCEYTESTTSPHIRRDTPATVKETLLIDQVDDSVKHAACRVLISRKESHNGDRELGEPKTTRRTWKATRKPHIVC
jgi:hypothetical protein